MSVEVIEHPRMVWPFRGEPNVPIPGKLRIRTTTVDPCPAYPNDRATAEAELEHVMGVAAPRSTEFRLILLDQEEPSRTNGHSYTEHIQEYVGQEWVNKGMLSVIVLSAKRIPIHPAMTRYLVAHEYGHCVEEWLLDARGLRLGAEDVANEYWQLRGMLGEVPACGAGVWHVTPCEVFANDWRRLIARTEVEYWPHPGIPRLEDLSKQRRCDLDRWWEGAMAELTKAATEKAA